ncbi:MAG TPA: HD domain-containing protein, partial [Balneolaceae bacterium]|nr:HD domain-containing protein [Balneolaceae bacterium]
MSLNDIDFRNFLKSSATAGQTDSAHDLAHIQRVVKNAELILKTEEADPETVIAAAWLHDCVTLPKNHPDRKKASFLAAEKASRFLKSTSFPDIKIKEVV